MDNQCRKIVRLSGLLHNAYLAGHALVAVAHLQVIHASREATQIKAVGVVVAGGARVHPLAQRIGYLHLEAAFGVGTVNFQVKYARGRRVGNTLTARSKASEVAVMETAVTVTSSM